MGVPDKLWSLGTEALNGADGDTAREAGVKYNTHKHQTTDVQAALDGAADPDADNVFATMDDLSSASLTLTANTVTESMGVAINDAGAWGEGEESHAFTIAVPAGLAVLHSVLITKTGGSATGDRDLVLRMFLDSDRTKALPSAPLIMSSSTLPHTEYVFENVMAESPSNTAGFTLYCNLVDNTLSVQTIQADIDFNFLSYQ